MFARQTRTRPLIFIASFIAIFLTAAAGAAVDRIRISYTSPGPQHGLLWLGDTAGIFKKNNLDLEIIYMPGNISAPSLMSGEVQFGQMTGALMSPVRLQGGDPVMLVSVQDMLDDRLVVRPGINKPEDLKGKRIAISRFGAARTCACSTCCRASA